MHKNTPKRKRVIYRQGDVLVMRVAAMPMSLVAINPKADPRGLVLAEGEATGHAHTIAWDDIATAGTDGASLYFKTDRPAALTHQQHDRILLQPGTYRVFHQREYRRAEVVRVQD